jgi:glycogen synthase
MKILMVNKFFYRKGGSETYMFQLSGLLRQAGHQVMEFSMQDEKNEPSQYRDYFIKSIDFNKREGLLKDFKKACHLLYSSEAKKKLEELIKKDRPDIVHLHNFNFQLTPSILSVLKKYQIPVVWTLHD